MPRTERNNDLTQKDIQEASSGLAGVVAYAHGDSPLPVQPPQEITEEMEAFFEGASGFIQACFVAFQDEKVAPLLFTDKENPDLLILAGSGNKLLGTHLGVAKREDESPKACIVMEAIAHDGEVLLAGMLHENMRRVFPDFAPETWEGPIYNHSGLSGHNGHGWGTNRYFRYLEHEDVVKDPKILTAFVRGIGALSKSIRERAIEVALPVEDIHGLNDVAEAFRDASVRITQALNPSNS